MKNLIIVLFILVWIGSGLFAQETQPTNKELLEKIEILEAELEKVKIESVDDNPLATGETVDWGKGLSMGIKYSSDTDTQIDFMYNFSIGKLGTRPDDNLYISKNQGMTLGLGLMFGLNGNADLYFDRDYIGYKAHLKVGGKIDLTSPVLMNYVSLSTSLSPQFNFIINDDNDSLESIDFGLELSIDANIWISNKTCVFTGFMTDPSLVSIYGNEPLVNPFAYKITFGVKTFL